MWSELDYFKKDEVILTECLVTSKLDFFYVQKHIYVIWYIIIFLIFKLYLEREGGSEIER